MPLLRKSTALPLRFEAAPTMTQERSVPHAKTPDELITQFSTDVWRYATSQLSRREDAEDIVMEVFAAAVADFRKVERADDQRLWLLGIARRKVADTLRRTYRRREEPLSSIEATAFGFETNEHQEVVRRALADLPEDQRQALVLKYVNGLSTDEVGRVLRRTSAATNSLLQRARQSMRAAMGTLLTDAEPELK